MGAKASKKKQPKFVVATPPKFKSKPLPNELSTTTTTDEVEQQQHHFAMIEKKNQISIEHEIIFASSDLTSNEHCSAAYCENLETIFVFGNKAFALDLQNTELHVLDDCKNITYYTAVMYKQYFVIMTGSRSGEYSTKILLYDTIAQTWSSRTYQHTGVAGHSVVHFGDCLYVFGGYTGSNFLNQVVEYNMELDTTKIHNQDTTICQPRSAHSAVAYRDEMIVYGGGNDEYYDDVFAFHFDTKKWRKLPISANGYKPSNRYAHGVGIVDHFMVVYGGKLDPARGNAKPCDDTDGNNICNHLLLLDMNNFCWLRIETDLPSTNYQCFVQISANEFLSFSGTNGSGNDDKITRIAIHVPIGATFKRIPVAYTDVQFCFL